MDEHYQKLRVWKAAMELVKHVYRVSRKFPVDEKFGLTSQLRRAAVSVPANIAEGYRRLHRAEYIQYLGIARGSLMELETLLLIARDLTFLDSAEHELQRERVTEISRMLTRLIQSLRKP